MGALDLKFYISIFFRRLPYFLVVFALIAAAGISVAMVLPAVYQARATIAVDRGQISEELVTSTIDVTATEQIQAIEARLMTRANLLDLADQFDVFEAGAGLNASEREEAMRESTSFQVINRGSFGNEGLITFTIAFSSGNPEVSASVVNEIVSLALEENKRQRTGRATDTLQFFEAEVSRLGGELGEIAAAILEFQNEHQDALPGNLDYLRNQQSRIQERLLRLEQEETPLNSTRARLVELYERTGDVRRSRDEMTPEERDLEDLRNELLQRQVVLSTSHPTIRNLRSRIAALETVVANQRRAPGNEEGEVVVLSELDLQLEQIDSRLTYIDTEQQRLDTELVQTAELIRMVPENALRLSDLELRRDTIQQEYNAAVASRSTAATGERLEVLSKGEKLEVIEAAVPPQWATSPNRKLMAAASLAAGIAAGLGLIVLLELLNRSIRRPVEITNALGIQTFGTIPYVRTRRERVVKHLIIITLLMMFVIGIPAAIWAVHTYYLPLDLLIEEAADKLGLAPYIDILF